MNKKIITLFLLFFTLTLYGQTQNQPEVGIVEHLGSQIPLDLKFINDKSDTVSLGKIIDKPTIISFVYFDCPGLCSPLLEGLGKVISQSEMVLGKDYQVVTISFNFRDTPLKAKEKKKRFTEKYSKGKEDGWIFLTGDSASIFKVTDAIGFKVKAVGFDFIHPSAIMALSPKGMITRYLYGITFLPLDFKMAIIEAGKGTPRPTIQKIMELCFSYDPQNKRYTLDVIKIAGILIAFFIVVFMIVLFIRRKRKNAV